MNAWLKFLIPIGLGLAAAALNLAAVSQSRPETWRGVRVARDLAAGEVLGAADLEPAELTGDPGSLARTAIPWSSMGILLARPVPRALRAGDLVLWRDAVPEPEELSAAPGEKALMIALEGIAVQPTLLRVGDDVGFLVADDDEPSPSVEGDGSADYLYLGPFSLLSVGERLSRGAGSGGGDPRVISVAVRVDDQGRLDDRARRLVFATERGRRGGGRGRIVALLLDPSPREDLAAASADEPSSP